MSHFLPPALIPDAPGRHSDITQTILHHVHVGRFFDSLLYEVTTDDFPHWKPMSFDEFVDVAYRLGLPESPDSKLRAAFKYVKSIAPDLGPNTRFILFGTDPATQVVWDTTTHSITTDIDPSEVVWRSPYPPASEDQTSPFLLSLAGDDPDHYQDILQTMAPLLMHTKPTGVIWWVGSGSNGKSSLVDALYRIFPDQLAGLTLKQINDERDTPSLNGVLANVVRESSEGYIEDTANYKKIGTHEPFSVHKFHTQDTALINGNLHHIFNANQVPTFNDKGLSARRRTIVIRFTQVFEDDITFNDRTFTPENLSVLIREMMRSARFLAANGYRYQFSAATLANKQETDAEANTAEEFVRSLVTEGMIAFVSFDPLYVHYENWCLEQGFAPMKIGGLRQAVKSVGFERKSYRTSDLQVANRYLLHGLDADIAMTEMSLYRKGLFREAGIPTTAKPDPQTTIPSPDLSQPTLGEQW